MTATIEEDRRFRRDMTIFVTPCIVSVLLMTLYWKPLLAFLGPKRFVTTTPDGVFATAAGTWDWRAADSICVKNPHAISFSADRTTMHITYRNPWTDSAGTTHRVATYKLQFHDASTIRGAIVGEARLTDDGKPVVWDLVLTSPASYTWHRTDWLEGLSTGEVARCPAGTEALIVPP